MNNSSAWLKEVLAGLPASGCVLYVRTADTEGGASLSQDDMRRSNMFGALLNGQLAGVVSAPGNKSVETATYILEGAGVPGNSLRLDSDIGDPSLYIRDLDLAMTRIRGLTVAEGREALLSGILRDSAPWASNDPQSAAREIQAKLVAEIQPGKVTVFVAPGVAIATTVAFALGLERTISAKDCPGPLNGATIFFGSDGIHVQMNAHQGVSRL